MIFKTIQYNMIYIVYNLKYNIYNIVNFFNYCSHGPLGGLAGVHAVIELHDHVGTKQEGGVGYGPLVRRRHEDDILIGIMMSCTLCLRIGRMPQGS
jgi:hypothetical protein